MGITWELSHMAAGKESNSERNLWAPGLPWYKWILTQQVFTLEEWREYRKKCEEEKCKPKLKPKRK
jgi:hypothetical protein